MKIIFSKKTQRKINKIKDKLIFLSKIHRFIPFLNKEENQDFTYDFKNRLLQIREQNSQDIYIFYYIPLAVNKLLAEKKPINDINLKSTAEMLLLKDIAENKLDELYCFKD